MSISVINKQYEYQMVLNNSEIRIENDIDFQESNNKYDSNKNKSSSTNYTKSI